ncbi:hypothetical protein [Microbacterium deminutum]|uniref:DUF4352 domain-containing protein n=1 Tax=Microbacterium deminutum TaxID=344164 RepID=A0ABN2RCL3_9MICO
MTTDTEVNYETRTFRVVRGMESRTIKKWADDGWEVISQTPGTIRTDITMRRPKPKPPIVPWIIGGGVVVVALATIITFGVISERAAAPQASGSPVPPATPTAPSKTASPTPTVDDTCDTAPASSSCKFGQTAIYSDSTRDGEMLLEITVLPPVEFTPSGSAVFFDNFADQQAPKPVNVYFPVTIKNVSPALARDNDFVFAHATNAEEGESDVLSVSDGEVTSSVDFQSLAPGDSYGFKSGWSMSTLDGIKFTISIDGLSGYSVTFSD